MVETKNGHSLSVIQEAMREDSSAEKVYERLCREYTGALEEDRMIDAARYADTAESLVRVAKGCLVCGDLDCNRGIAYIDGGNMIHADKHPENRHYGKV